MDIRNKFKQGLAAVGTVALLATSVFSGAGVALAAGTYTDDDGQWYEAAVETGVAKGVWDKTQPKFRGGDNIIRAEAATTMVRVVDGLAGFTAPAKPTFVDVPAVGSATEQWYSKYVEAAASLGIMTGDKTPQGDPTGFARPTGNLTRAEAAALIVRTFELSTENNAKYPEPFPDVNPTDWFASVVQTAYANGVIKGDPDGKAYPNRFVNRAEMAAMIARAYSPTTPGGTMACGANEYMDKTTDTCKPIPTCKTGEYFNETTAKCEVISTSNGDLEVVLGANTPDGTNLPLGAQNVDLFDFDLKAVGDKVQVTQILVTRLGVGEVTDWEALYLYEGDMRITSERTISSDTNQAIFNLSNFVVDAGKTRTLTLVGNVASDAENGNTHKFSVAAATSVKTNAKATKGTFPVVGEQFSFSGVSVGTATFDAVTISEPSIGEKDAEIGAFKLTASGANDILLERITLTQNGTFDPADFSNLRLLAGSDEVAKATNFVNDTVTFVLAKPYKLSSGQNRTFYVRGDINGGKTTETIELYLDFDADAKVIDDQYGYGARVINNTLTIDGVTAVNLQGGDITIVDTSAPSTQIAVNSTNQSIAAYQMTAALDVLVRDTEVMVELEDASGLTPDVSGTLAADEADSIAAAVNPNEYNINTTAHVAGLVAADMLQVGSSYARVVSNDGSTNDGGLIVFSTDDLTAYTSEPINEVNPYAYIKNVKLVDTKTSDTLAGPLTLASQGTKSGDVDTTYTKTFTEDYDLTAGTTRDLAVMVDIDQNMVAGYRVRATVTYPASSIKAPEQNEFVALEEIVGSPLAGNWMSIEESTLTVSRSSSPVSQEYVLGQQGVNGLGLSFQSGDAGDTEIRKIIVRVYGDDGGTQFNDDNGDGSGNLLVSSVSLYNGNTLVSGPKGLSSSANTEFDIATFDQLNLIVKKGETLNLMVKANLLNTKVGMVAFDVVPSTDIIAEDVDNNTINLSSTPVNTYNANHFAVEHEIIDTGTLTASEAGSPSADIAVGGTNQMLVASYDFQAVDENFDVNKLTVINDLSDTFDAAVNTSAVESVTIKYPDAQGVMQSRTVNMTNGSANFSGLDFIARKSPATNKLEIYANLAAVDQPTLSGLKFRLGLRDTSNTVATFEAVGMASSNTITSGMTISDGANVSQFVLRKTVPTFTQSSISSVLASQDMELYDVTVKADAAGPVYLARMVFDVTTFFATPASADLTDFYVNAGGSKLQDVDVNIFCSSGAGVNVDDDANTTTTLEDCDGANNNGVANGTYKVMVSFDKQQTIAANASKKFTLNATVVGANGDNDSVSVRLATGDEFAIADGPRFIHDNAIVSGLFSTATTDFSSLLSTARNFIWSDGSADTHLYPTVTDGDVTNVSGSQDWINGYQLEIDALKTKSNSK